MFGTVARMKLKPGSFEKMQTASPHPVFGDPEQDRGMRHRENPFWLIEQALCRWPTERPRLHIDCGTEDALLTSNRRFADHMNFVGYPCAYRELPGQHSWPYWDRAFKTALPELARSLGATAKTPQGMDADATIDTEKETMCRSSI